MTLAWAFDVSSQSNFIAYWGQSSAGSQKPLKDYCQDSSVDAVVLAFLYQFPSTTLDFSSNCRGTFPGSQLLHCPEIAADIKQCQSKGKAVILSMGGAAGAYGFSSDSDAQKYADTVWDMFLGGSGSQRPFDDAILDGIDLDIEGGSTTGYAAFVAQLRSHFQSSNKQYYITGAPQCPYPDAMLGSTLDSAWFDMVFVQFYNNYCGLDAYPQGFNYDKWDSWAKSQSVNKNVKLYIGAPGSQSAAGRGYVDASTLSKIASDVRSKYSTFGGVMVWDASQAFDSSSWGTSVSSSLKSGASNRKRMFDMASAAPVATRSANITAGALHARLDLVEGAAGRRSEGDTFGFLIKAKSTDHPIQRGWQMHIPLPAGMAVAKIDAQGHQAIIVENTLVVMDGGSKDSSMAVEVYVAGQHTGNEFVLPDPAIITLQQ
ncbi:Chitinase 2 [Coemansia sp. RSA 1290]|nr:Chitinase 2 [Coemansia sp. RSA 1821]KAJ2631697.1 Chitinase 2 [Coemansia sp. RSA 1290]KAJ2648723.1 Chitinase 2 [Coemansia sp. RSA 1250]